MKPPKLSRLIRYLRFALIGTSMDILQLLIHLLLRPLPLSQSTLWFLGFFFTVPARGFMQKRYVFNENGGSLTCGMIPSLYRTYAVLLLSSTALHRALAEANFDDRVNWVLTAAASGIAGYWGVKRGVGGGAREGGRLEVIAGLMMMLVVIIMMMMMTMKMSRIDTLIIIS